MARLGSVAAAPFLGGEFVSLYLGTERVPTVPGPMAWDGTPPASGGDQFDEPFVAPVNDGGSEITGYNIYEDDVLVIQIEPTESLGALAIFATPGVYEIAVAAVNAVGEGPRLKTVYEYVED
jgi:hypothetical protein